MPEWQFLPARDLSGKSHNVSLHDWVFSSQINPTKYRRWLPFSSTLVLSGLNVYEGLAIDDPKKAEWREFVFRARGRDLKGAVLDLASLPKVDFEGAQLQGASAQYAHLEGASLIQTQLQGVSLQFTQLQGASLDFAQLQGASLDFAKLQGASLVDVGFQAASLNLAQLEGANLRAAQLQGASLDGAELQGSSLDGAMLQGASLFEAQVAGASLELAQLQGASFSPADLQGAFLGRARLLGTDLNSALLQGSSLERADLRGASLEGATMQATDVSGARLWRTNSDILQRRSWGIRLVGAGWDPLGWSDNDYQRLTNLIMKSVPSDRRGFALSNVRIFYRAVPCTSAALPSRQAATWRKALERAANDTIAGRSRMF